MFAGCTAVVTCDEERAHSEEGEENDCNDDEVVLCEQLVMKSIGSPWTGSNMTNVKTVKMECRS